MKTKQALTAIALSLTLLLTGCQQASSKYSDYILKDLIKHEAHKLPQDETLCGHEEGYHNISAGLAKLSANGKTIDDFVSEKKETEELNIVEFVKYADISGEAFAEYVNTAFPDKDEKGSENSGYKEIRELYSSDIIFSGNEAKINNHFNKNVSTYQKTEAEIEPSKNFFCIHGSLIRQVGKDKYHEYLKYVIGSKYDNIKNFTEYFKIDKDTLENVLKTAEASDFYDVEDLF